MIVIFFVSSIPPLHASLILCLIFFASHLLGILSLSYLIYSISYLFHFLYIPYLIYHNPTYSVSPDLDTFLDGYILFEFEFMSGVQVKS